MTATIKAFAHVCCAFPVFLAINWLLGQNSTIGSFGLFIAIIALIEAKRPRNDPTP